MNQKLLTLFNIFFIVFFSKAQNDTIIQTGKLNLAVLKLNYSNFTFEGGTISYLDRPESTKDSIPFNIIYQSPLDFGNICLRIEPTLDTLFNGSIIWMGTGVINQPSNFYTNSPFEMGDSLISIPNSIQFINENGQLENNPYWTNAVDDCWNSISNLKVTENFANYEFHAAIYLYTPVVGFTDYNFAKWIVFLYYQDAILKTPTIQNNENLLYPNPFSETINIDKDLHGIAFKISKPSGEIVKTGKCYTGEITDLALFSSGVYFIEIQKDQQKKTYKIVKN
jgi:hypothetical protein